MTILPILTASTGEWKCCGNLLSSAAPQLLFLLHSPKQPVSHRSLTLTLTLTHRTAVDNLVKWGQTWNMFTVLHNWFMPPGADIHGRRGEEKGGGRGERRGEGRGGEQVAPVNECSVFKQMNGPNCPGSNVEGCGRLGAELTMRIHCRHKSSIERSRRYGAGSDIILWLTYQRSGYESCVQHATLLGTAFILPEVTLSPPRTWTRLSLRIHEWPAKWQRKVSEWLSIQNPIFKNLVWMWTVSKWTNNVEKINSTILGFSGAPIPLRILPYSLRFCRMQLSAGAPGRLPAQLLSDRQ